MKAITSKDKLLKKLKQENLVTCGNDIWYLSDWHKSTVGKVVANKIINEGIVEPARNPSWFERAWELKKK